MKYPKFITLTKQKINTTKKSIFILMLGATLPAFAQQVNFKATIPVYYHYAKSFAVLNNSNDTIMAFSTPDKKTKAIVVNSQTTRMKKRKILVSSNGDTIAYRKKKHIVFPSQKISLKEVKSKKGWTYYQDGQKILEVNYFFDKAERKYKISGIMSDNNPIAQNALMMCLGRFDLYVHMDRPEWQYHVMYLSAALGVKVLIILL